METGSQWPDGIAKKYHVCRYNAIGILPGIDYNECQDKVMGALREGRIP